MRQPAEVTRQPNLMGGGNLFKETQDTQSVSPLRKQRTDLMASSMCKKKPVHILTDGLPSIYKYHPQWLTPRLGCIMKSPRGNLNIRTAGSAFYTSRQALSYTGKTANCNKFWVGIVLILSFSFFVLLLKICSKSHSDSFLNLSSCPGLPGKNKKQKNCALH